MDLKQMPLAGLAAACRVETDKFRHGETYSPDFCFELIRRAVCERDESAWETVVSQYRGIVLAWIRRHPASAAADEGDDYWVNRTFERFWKAVGPERFGLFAGLPALLNYLKVCAHSVLLDEARARKAAQLDTRPEPTVESRDAMDVEAVALGSLVGRELWRAIDGELQDESERLVVYLSFALDFKPREVHERHPDRFPTVADVYRIKRNVLDRLRRSTEIQAFLK